MDNKSYQEAKRLIEELFKKVEEIKQTTEKLRRVIQKGVK